MQQKVFVQQDFPASVEKVFADLSDHESFGRILGLNMKRVKAGIEHPNGVGSVRRLNLEPLPNFEETITRFVPNSLIEYKITRGMPLKNHLGTMRFSEKEGRASLDYTIVFESRIPYLGGVIKTAICNSVIKGLKRYTQTL